MSSPYQLWVLAFAQARSQGKGHSCRGHDLVWLLFLSPHLEVGWCREGAASCSSGSHSLGVRGAEAGRLAGGGPSPDSQVVWSHLLLVASIDTAPRYKHCVSLQGLLVTEGHCLPLALSAVGPGASLGREGPRTHAAIAVLSVASW